MKLATLLFGIVLLSCLAQAADQWRIQFFHDEEDSTLTINDVCFPSARRGIAVGYLTEGNKTRPRAVITSDGGETWSFVKLKQPGLSVFFLNDSIGWMVTDGGLWKTEESGRSWKKISKKPDGLLRVFFRDENRGWAVGLHKGIYTTVDGGKDWLRLPIADEVKSKSDYTFFSWITFADEKNGVIAGASDPPRKGAPRLPGWMAPERMEKFREWPSLNILIETHDGGQTWKASTTSMFGNITKVRIARDGRGLGLVEFFHAFQWPSEVFQIDWRTGKNSRVFRQKDRAVTDIALFSRGSAYLAAIEPPGQLARSPIPGKVKILKSRNLTDWQEMEVDYRVFAHRAMFAAVDEDHIWVATDTGMILRLQ
jgi:hypothetical protein